MVRTPRDNFVASAHCAAFKAIHQNEAFEAATLAALLEMAAETCQQGLTPNQAADAGNQMAGPGVTGVGGKGEWLRCLRERDER